MHPALLLKNVLAEYLRSYKPPGTAKDEPPVFSEDAGFRVLHDENLDEALDLSGADLLIYEAARAEESAEGMDVWQFSLAVSIAMPRDMESSEFEARHDSLWSYLSGQYPGDVSTGGDIPGPLAGRLNALSLQLNQDDPQAWPRILCVGDAWQFRRELREADSAAVRVGIVSFFCISEVMPPQFIPA
jgi:hypothetical protein